MKLKINNKLLLSIFTLKGSFIVGCVGLLLLFISIFLRLLIFPPDLDGYSLTEHYIAKVASFTSDISLFFILFSLIIFVLIFFKRLVTKYKQG